MSNNKDSGFIGRPCHYTEDIERLIDLLLKHRQVIGLYSDPHPWRFRQFLSSRVWESAQDSRIWEDSAGLIVGFGMLWRRNADSPYLVLERFVDSATASDDLVEEMLKWGMKRAKRIAVSLDNPKTLYIKRLGPEGHSDNLVTSYGFSLVKRNPDGVHSVHFSRKLKGENPVHELPEGYVIRPLQNIGEMDAYDELFEFTAVTSTYREETFNSEEYEHLVVVDPSGKFVAYCELSICRAEWHLTAQRHGWISYIGTRPENRRQGLGRAVLLESLRQLLGMGAETVALTTISNNHSAIKLYNSTGFKRINVSLVPRYEKEISIE